MKQYIDKYKKDRKRVRDLAELVGVQRIYLTQIAGGHSRPSAVLARKLHEGTNGEIQKSALRPDVFPPDVLPVVDIPDAS